MTLVPILVRPIGGRAGTTLLMQVLGTSPEVAFDRIYPFERGYFSYFLERANGMLPEHQEKSPRAQSLPRRLVRRIGSRLPAWADWRRPQALRGQGSLPSNPQIFDLETLVHLSFEKQWEAFSEAVTRKSEGTNPMYYAEKFPRVRRSKIDIPIRFLWLVRDPRDQWASINAFDKKRGYYGFGRRRWQSRSSYLQAFIRATHAYVKREARRSDDELLVRYEDLVNDVRYEAERIGKWLAVDLDPGPLMKPGSPFGHHMTSRSPHTSIGRWREDLPEKEQRVLNNELATVLRRYGYER